jgi:hypothetical protein
MRKDHAARQDRHVFVIREWARARPPPELPFPRPRRGPQRPSIATPPRPAGTTGTTRPPFVSCNNIRPNPTPVVASDAIEESNASSIGQIA